MSIALRSLLPGAASAVVAGAVLLFPGGDAHAQQRLRLSDVDDRWVPVVHAAPGEEVGRLASAREALARGQHERAELLAAAWISRNPGHPLTPDALLIRAESLYARRDFYKALFDYETIARSYPGSDAFLTAAERQLDIGIRFLSGMKRRLWGMRILSATEEGEELLIRVQERLPGSQIAERAALELADWYFRESKMTLAAEMYAIVLLNFPRTAQRDLARRRLLHAHLAAFKGPEFDAGGLYEARAMLREMQIVDPAGARDLGGPAILIRIEESDATKMLTTARWYERSGDPIAAEYTIRRLIRTYPSSIATRDAIELLHRLVARLPRARLEAIPEYRALGILDQQAPTDGAPADREAAQP